ncbi:N-acyl homoserine lactonase family protein [Variovorax paradoxus]|uniref:N-acyl homoserine lactonase family protein n=1 Tax=Variovorax paradoxus TaxID=34073 RepID=UPI0019326989|nr:N-acyl homoserine lactonase family protein [Variovorax paradoxus]
MKRLTSLLGAALALLALSLTAVAQTVNSPSEMRLYALDCGRYETSDLGRLSDTFEHTGERGERVSPCWLIRHPKGDLIWDLGLGDKYAASPEGVAFGSLLRFQVGTTLASQLRSIGLAPTDIKYVSVSHLHLDHLGNAAAFSGATWLVSRRELIWANSVPTPPFIDPVLVETVKEARKIMFDQDYDVFGDGTVQILKAPGHTPGSQVLLLKLAKAGPVLISGDLYHSHEAFDKSFVPGTNDSRADTLASMDRVHRLLRNTAARLVIHHDPGDFRAMPQFPAYLD